MTDAAPIDFWFDFSSPFGYLMSEKIDTVAARHGRAVVWRPFLLGAVYKLVGSQPLPAIPMKGPYSIRDFIRSARYHDVPFRLPDAFPVGTQHAARGYYWLQDTDPALAHHFAHAAFRAYFIENRDISQLDVVLDVAKATGADRTALAEALAGEAVRERLKAECAAAIDTGVFGSPFVIVDGEPFWGVDRLPQIERWLETGGF